jgi:signal transduction histidine kinase
VLALQATPPPEPDGTAAAYPYHLAVMDNGIGIPAGSREDIFLIFHRLHDARRYRGTGIGLAICRKVVQNHGGALWVDSVEGQGSTFHIALPLVPPG